jgi:hypothetical protein
LLHSCLRYAAPGLAEVNRTSRQNGYVVEVVSNNLVTATPSVNERTRRTLIGYLRLSNVSANRSWHERTRSGVRDGRDSVLVGATLRASLDADQSIARLVGGCKFNDEHRVRSVDNSRFGVANMF